MTTVFAEAPAFGRVVRAVPTTAAPESCRSDLRAIRWLIMNSCSIKIGKVPRHQSGKGSGMAENRSSVAVPAGAPFVVRDRALSWVLRVDRAAGKSGITTNCVKDCCPGQLAETRFELTMIRVIIIDRSCLVNAAALLYWQEQTRPKIKPGRRTNCATRVFSHTCHRANRPRCESSIAATQW